MNFILSCIVLAFAVNAQDMDLGVLNYALTLEHLENAFYKQGMSNFTLDHFDKGGYSKEVRGVFERISSHEEIHVSTLISVINATYPGMAVPPCEYAFGVTSVKEFVATARALERTGVSAYLGRVADITAKPYLTAAGTIVTIEARHASFLNVISGISGMPEPFDTPLDATTVVSIASQFIKSCPYDLGVKPYSKLSASKDGSNLKLSDLGSGGNMTSTVFCKFLYGAMTMFTEVKDGSCMYPENAKGDTYVFVVSDNTTTGNILYGPAIVSGMAEKSINGKGSGGGSVSGGGSGSGSASSSSWKLDTDMSLLMLVASFVYMM